MGTTTITACCAPVAEAALGEDEAEQLAAAFKVLADPVRLRLLSLVANAENGEACGCDLTEPVGRSQPTVSHHLRILRQAPELGTVCQPLAWVLSSPGHS